MFADDILLVSAHKSFAVAEEYLQADWDEVAKWSHDNYLVINSDKTKVLHIATPFMLNPREPIIKLHSCKCFQLQKKSINTCFSDCKYIPCCNNFKYLGITVDCFFRWDLHVQRVCDRLRLLLLKLYYLRDSLSYEVKKLIYIALGESIIRYGLEGWGYANDVQLRKINIVQKRLLRIVQGETDCRLTLNDLITKCGLLSTKGLFYYNIIIKNYCNNEYLEFKENSFGLRNRKYLVPRVLNNLGKKQLRFLVPTLINELPQDLNTFVNMKKLKNFLKKWLQNNHV